MQREIFSKFLSNLFVIHIMTVIKILLYGTCCLNEKQIKHLCDTLGLQMYISLYKTCLN